MMNKQGGDLYIGVNDKGFVTNSISNEFQYLNAFPPSPNFTYPSNPDGYKRFIIDWVFKNLGNFATTLISIDFKDYSGVIVAKIHVDKSNVPVWFKRDSLYVRADAETRQLRGGDITSHILQIDKKAFLQAQKNDQAAFDKRLSEIKAKEKPSGHILVVYPNGDYIHEKTDVDTLLAVIHKAGIENVKRLGLVGRQGKGNTPFVPFIGTNVYLDNPKGTGKTQRDLDGYLVFVKTGQGEKVNKLIEISNGLGLKLHIEKY